MCSCVSSVCLCVFMYDRVFLTEGVLGVREKDQSRWIRCDAVSQGELNDRAVDVFPI